MTRHPSSRACPSQTRAGAGRTHLSLKTSPFESDIATRVAPERPSACLRGCTRTLVLLVTARRSRPPNCLRRCGGALSAVHQSWISSKYLVRVFPVTKKSTVTNPFLRYDIRVLQICTAGADFSRRNTSQTPALLAPTVVGPSSPRRVRNRARSSTAPRDPPLASLSLAPSSSYLRRPRRREPTPGGARTP